MCPLTVRAWPDSTDPRGGLFSVVGYDYGQVPPNQFLLTTTGATGAYVIFNDGVLVTAVDFGDTATQYTSAAMNAILLKDGSEEPIGPPPLFTVSMQLNVQIIGEALYIGTTKDEFPTAIRTWSIDMVKQGAGDSDIPNPILMTPKNHLFTI